MYSARQAAPLTALNEKPPMKIFKTVVVPETTREVIVSRKCDLCGKESTTHNWGGDIWEINETELKVTVRQKGGDNYPEGGVGEEYEIDICPECFVNRLVPWLKSEGADIKPVEWDW